MASYQFAPVHHVVLARQVALVGARLGLARHVLVVLTIAVVDGACVVQLTLQLVALWAE